MPGGLMPGGAFAPCGGCEGSGQRHLNPDPPPGPADKPGPAAGPARF